MPYIGNSPANNVRGRFYYTATAAQTVFSGADSNGKTLAYQDGGYVDVYLNGVLLQDTTDYTATTKTSVTLTSGATAGDLVEIIAYGIFSVGDTVSAANGGTFKNNIDVVGTVTSDGLTVDGNVSVDGGTIKLDGNYPTGTGNVALGDTALDSNVSGGSNTAIGAEALTANTASNNTAVGYQAGYSNTTGTGNAFFVRISGYSNTADYNNAFGAASLYSNTSGTLNVAVGDASLYANTTGSYNTSIGGNALRFNTTASNNTAVGYQAGYSNTTGSELTFFGYKAGANTTGSYNTYVGSQTGITNTSGTGNTGVGWGAISSTSGATDNTAVGYGAGSSITTGSKNTVLGRYSGNQGGLDIRTASNRVVLSDGDGKVVINSFADGNNYKCNIGNMTYGSGGYSIGLAVRYAGGGSQYGIDFLPNANGANYTTFWNESGGIAGSIVHSGSTSVTYNTSSDYRLKENVVAIENATDRLKQLEPKRFNFIDEPDRTVDGFIAHEVQDIVPEAITGQKDEMHDDGTPRYQGIDQSKLVPLLVAAVKEQQATIEALEARIAALEAN